eukprot:TRINITY_DN1532_c0_g1_i2.p1 TRINITY_DN1532_c0_g1~~TRINITY_DN1532_c0_g1_i2.p1  ORF type:complete len:297 (+),score=37.67 TRINITY_DN1532_c0_g1_i2:978-1868(+)
MRKNPSNDNIKNGVPLESYIEALEFNANPKVFDELKPQFQPRKRKIQGHYKRALPPIPISLSKPHNFNPQNIVFCSNSRIATSTTGTKQISIYQVNITKQTTELVESISSLYHCTGIAYDGTNFFTVDYKGNQGSLYKIDREHGSERILPGLMGYGGCPIVVTKNTLWRTSPSQAYNWNNLTSVSKYDRNDLLNPVSTFMAPFGIGDFCCDTEEKSLWLLRYQDEEYTAGAWEYTEAQLCKIDASTGQLLASFHVAVPAQCSPCGLTYDGENHLLWLLCFKLSDPNNSYLVPLELE